MDIYTYIERDLLSVVVLSWFVGSASAVVFVVFVVLAALALFVFIFIVGLWAMNHCT